MINITNLEECSGCGACKNICPKKCIEMKYNEEGFLYPNINKDICINCNRCSNICPINNKKIYITSKVIDSAIVCASKDKNIRKNSTSGGFFAVLAKKVIEEGGWVCGVIYDKEFLPKHIITNNINDLKNICRSKYIQSNTENIYNDVKEYLEKNQIVLFSGTPCQVAALKNFLNKDYENLLTCDVVCRGVISAKLWKKHLLELKKRYNSDIEYIGFREKYSSFHKSRLVIYFKNGKKYFPSTNIEAISRFFSLGISLRSSCYNCAFKGTKRDSDFTMFDCWNLSRLVDEVKDDDKGYTNVLLHTTKAMRWLVSIKKELFYWDIDLLKAKEYDGIMIEKSVKRPENRAAFFEDLNYCSIKMLIDKYAYISWYLRLRETIKNFLIKIKLYEY